jgi:hypothetical protein
MIMPHQNGNVRILRGTNSTHTYTSVVHTGIGKLATTDIMLFPTPGALNESICD